MAHKTTNDNVSLHAASCPNICTEPVSDRTLSSVTLSTPFPSRRTRAKRPLICLTSSLTELCPLWLCAHRSRLEGLVRSARSSVWPLPWPNSVLCDSVHTVPVSKDSCEASAHLFDLFPDRTLSSVTLCTPFPSRRTRVKRPLICLTSSLTELCPLWLCAHRSRLEGLVRSVRSSVWPLPWPNSVLCDSVHTVPVSKDSCEASAHLFDLFPDRTLSSVTLCTPFPSRRTRVKRPLICLTSSLTELCPLWLCAHRSRLEGLVRSVRSSVWPLPWPNSVLCDSVHTVPVSKDSCEASAHLFDLFPDRTLSSVTLCTPFPSRRTRVKRPLICLTSSLTELCPLWLCAHRSRLEGLVRSVRSSVWLLPWPNSVLCDSEHTVPVSKDSCEASAHLFDLFPDRTLSSVTLCTPFPSRRTRVKRPLICLTSSLTELCPLWLCAHRSRLEGLVRSVRSSVWPLPWPNSVLCDSVHTVPVSKDLCEASAHLFDLFPDRTLSSVTLSTPFPSRRTRVKRPLICLTSSLTELCPLWLCAHRSRLEGLVRSVRSSVWPLPWPNSVLCDSVHTVPVSKDSCEASAHLFDLFPDRTLSSVTLCTPFPSRRTRVKRPLICLTSSLTELCPLWLCAHRSRLEGLVRSVRSSVWPLPWPNSVLCDSEHTVPVSKDSCEASAHLFDLFPDRTLSSVTLCTPFPSRRTRAKRPLICLTSSLNELCPLWLCAHRSRLEGLVRSVRSSVWPLPWPNSVLCDSEHTVPVSKDSCEASAHLFDLFTDRTLSSVTLCTPFPSRRTRAKRPLICLTSSLTELCPLWLCAHRSRLEGLVRSVRSSVWPLPWPNSVLCDSVHTVPVSKDSCEASAHLFDLFPDRTLSSVTLCTPFPSRRTRAKRPLICLTSSLTELCPLWLWAHRSRLEGLVRSVRSSVWPLPWPNSVLCDSVHTVPVSKDSCEASAHLFDLFPDRTLSSVTLCTPFPSRRTRRTRVKRPLICLTSSLTELCPLWLCAHRSRLEGLVWSVRSSVWPLPWPNSVLCDSVHTVPVSKDSCEASAHLFDLFPFSLTSSVLFPCTRYPITHRADRSWISLLERINPLWW